MKRRLVIAAALFVAPAAVAPAAAAAASETAVLAGGCFWGLEAVFEHVRGVSDVVSGYAGGRAEHADYESVSGERSGHAEAVRIRYDPAVVSYLDLLRVYFAVAHDPTQLNRQGPDTGPSYRSAIFPQNAAQQRTAQIVLKRLAATKAYKSPIVTRLESGKFFPAEPYHQDFMRRHPRHPYIVAHDVPKVAALKRAFPNLWKG